MEYTMTTRSAGYSYTEHGPSTIILEVFRDGELTGRWEGWQAEELVTEIRERSEEMDESDAIREVVKTSEEIIDDARHDWYEYFKTLD